MPGCMQVLLLLILESGLTYSLVHVQYRDSMLQNSVCVVEINALVMHSFTESQYKHPIVWKFLDAHILLTKWRIFCYSNAGMAEFVLYIVR